MAFRQEPTGSACIAGLSMAAGSLIHYKQRGADAMLEEFGIWVSYVLMGAGLSVFLILVWHLISWPARLLYESERECNRLRSQLQPYSPLTIIYPPEANLPSKITAFRRVTAFFPHKFQLDPPLPTKHQFYIGIGNSSGQTIRNVGVRIYYANIPDRPLDVHLLEKNSKSPTINVSPKMTEMFILGEVVRREESTFHGFHSGIATARHMETLIAAAKDGVIGLSVPQPNGTNVPLLRNDGQILRVVAYGDDVDPARAEILLNMKGEISVEVRPIESLDVDSATPDRLKALHEEHG